MEPMNIEVEMISTNTKKYLLMEKAKIKTVNSQYNLQEPACRAFYKICIVYVSFEV